MKKKHIRQLEKYLDEHITKFNYYNNDSKDKLIKANKCAEDDESDEDDDSDDNDEDILRKIEIAAIVKGYLTESFRYKHDIPEIKIFIGSDAEKLPLIIRYLIRRLFPPKLNFLLVSYLLSRKEYSFVNLSSQYLLLKKVNIILCYTLAQFAVSFAFDERLRRFSKKKLLLCCSLNSKCTSYTSQNLHSYFRFRLKKLNNIRRKNIFVVIRANLKCT
ncbi:hypothetical protein RFI_00296 [Reticulomyxa filosa]|uniref:Uncharacterized protein n=1 Tax=Reticulomyxa filosa TaxID=46433 RepID=X6PFC3_RETFI|nr:hypothetical protein RFI_00296 [Reticulomyxa filosa]|eukprot:ETO36764.1 hypothetical protein RFI_00296 [Reticulomyxa filosa]